jgi:hypothetical protein
MPETLQDLYGKLEKANIKLPDYNTFEKKYSVEGGADVLYGKLNSANVKLPDLNTFKSKYFNSQENVQSVNPPAQTTEPAATVTPTVEKPKWESTFEGVKTYKNNQSEDINLPVIPDARRSYAEVSTNSLGDILYGKTNEKTKSKNTELSFNENDPEALFKNQVRKLGVNVESLNTDDPSAIYFQNKASENYNKVLNTLDEIKNKTQLSQTGTTEDEVNAISEIVEDELLPIRNEKQSIINQLNSNKRSLQSIDTQNPQPGFLPDLQQEEEQKIFEQQKKDIYKQNEELENRLSAINKEENNISGIFSQAVYANRSLNVETFKQNPNQILQLTQDKLIFGAIQDNINSSSLSDNIKRKAKLLNAQITNDGGKLLDVLSDRVYEDQPNEYANKTLGISKAELQKQGAEGIDKLLKFSQADVTQDMKALEKYKNLPKNFIESSIKSGEMTEEEAKEFIVDYNTQLEKVNSKLKAIKYIEETGNQYFGDYKRFEYYKEKQNELAKNFNFRQDVVGAVQSGTFNNVLDAVDFGKTTATKAKSALGVISPEQEAAQYLKVASDQDFDYMRYTPDYFKTLQFITKDEKGENKINPRALGYAALKTTAESYMLYLTGLGITKATQLNRLKNYGKVGEYVADHIGIIPASELYIQPDMFNEAMKKYESGEISLDQVYNMSAAQAGIEGATEMWFLPEAKALKGVINSSTKELALNLFFKSKIGKDLVGSFGEKAVKAVWEGTKTGGGEAWEEVLGNIFNDQYNYQVRQNNPDYIYQEQNTLESNAETAINTFISMYPTILLGMGTSYRNNNSKATAQMAQYEVAQNPSQFNQYAKDFIDNTKNLNWYFPTQSKEEVYKEIVANNTKLSEVYNQAIPVTSKLDSESEKIDYFNALNNFTTLSSKLNLTKEQEEELESASKKLISYKLKVATSDALREADPVKYNAAKIENFIDTTNYDIQDVTKLALLGKTLDNSLEEYKDKEGYETLVEKIQSKIDLVNENISKLENKSTSQEKVDLIQTPVVETVEKSPLEQTKEKISSFSKEELSSYNPLLDKTLSKEEKKEVYDLKLQRLQELEDTENIITFGNKTFKKGEQVTTDQGKTYWNLDGLTEDGRLKLSRTLVNKKTGQETSESSIISDPNDVSVYTKQTTPQEGEETEENVANFFLGQQEETADNQSDVKIYEYKGKQYEVTDNSINEVGTNLVKPIDFKEEVESKGTLVTQQSTDNIEAKKADIERRRTSSLRNITQSSLNFDAGRGYAGKYNIPGTEIIDSNGKPSGLFQTEIIREDTKEEVEKEINAKYDAELAALEQPIEAEEIEEENLSKGTTNDKRTTQSTEVVTPQEVSSVKPQELEQAKKEQDKEVVEKFETPATPFKNGKVKTSNWNKVLITITPENLLNYRVKVVNTSSLKFEQLPYQTQQYFEEQALKQKTTVEDVISKDKGKLLVLTDKEGNYILEGGLPVVTNFPDGALATYKEQYERQGLTEQQYFDKIQQIKDARKNNSTLLIERISNYPVEITQDSNELSVVVGTNDFSIAKGSKGFPVAMLGSQEVNLISRKLTENELNTIVEIAFNFGSSGVYSQEAVKLTTEQKNNSERYQKLQYLKNLIFTGKGITTSGKKKLNFECFLKSKNPEEFAKYGFSTKITYGNELVTSKEQLREILKNYSFNEINVNKDLSESLIKFTTYKIEDGKIVVDKPYPTYKDFLKDTIKTKGVSATKLQDNFYIEVGDTDGTLSAKLEEAKNEPAVTPVVEIVKPTLNTEIVQESQAVEEVKSLLNKKKKKSLDAPTDKDNFAGLLRSKKLPQEVIAEQNKKAKEWFDKSPLAEYISLNQLQNIVNSDAYASWNWGAITLFKGSQYTDLYHEAWHEFSQLYLTKKQKEALYNEIKKANVIIGLPNGKKIKSSEASNKEIEEHIAEDFRNYAKSDGKLILNNRFKRNSTFRKIWNFLKELFTKTTDLQTVYERLYTGNISKYKRNTNNAFWGNLNLGIQLKDNKQLSDTDTKNLYRAIDSLIGTIFQQNGKPVTMMFADNKVLATVYGAIYKKLVTEYNDLYDSIEERTTKNLSQGEAEQLKADAQLLDDLDVVIENWNEIVKTHRQYSAFFNISKDKIAFDEEGNVVSIDDKFTEETDEGNSRNSELIKNENVSSKEAASNETIFTIATLPRYNLDGTRAMNPFLPFVQDVVDFNSTWDKLTTATNNHLEYTQILAKIEELGKTDKSFQDLINRLPNSEKSLTDDEQRMKGAFMNDISKPLVQVYELIMSPMNGKMMFSYKTAASSDLDKIKRQWNDNFESTSPFIKQNPDDSLYTDKEEIISTYGAKGSKPAFYYNKQDYEKADKKQMFENRIDFLSKIGITFTEDILSDIEFQDLITKDFVKTPWTKHSSTFSLYELITKAKDDISSLPQLSKVKPASEFNYFAKSIEELANYELLGSNNLFAQSVKNAEQNNVWQIRQWNYITKIFNALNDVEKYPTYQDLLKEDWLKQFNFEANPYVKGIYLNTLFDLNTESPTFGQRRVIKKGNKTIYPTISLHDYNGMRLNLADNKTNEGKGTTSLTAFEKIVQNINSLLLFNTQENLRYGDKSSSFSTVISHYVNKSGKLEERKAIIPFESFINNREAIVLPQEAFKYLVADLRQEIIPMARFENEQIGSNLKYYNKNITDFGTFDGILTKETKDAIKKQIIKPNIQDFKEIDRILATLPLKEEFENYIQTKSEQLSDLLDTQGILEDTDIFDPKIIEEKVKTPEGQTISQPLPKQSMLYGYIVNSLLYNIEHTKLISFDPRFYKNPKNVIKRLSAFSAMGNIFIVDEQTNNFIDDKKNLIKDAVAKKLNIKIPKIFSDGKIRSVISKDNEYSANKLLENYKEKFLATGKYTTEQLQTILKAYSNVNEADGQGHITLDLLRESKLRAGSSHWTKAHQAAYEKEAKFLAGESTEGMSSEEAMTLFPPQKWQYAGIGLWNGWLPYPVFYKFSVVPLIPSAIKNTPFEEIHDNLVRQNVGLHLFESGSKASGALNENGQYNPFYSDYEKRTPYLGEYTINTVFFQYLKEQVNVDPKLKEEVSFSTQMRKLLHLNLFNNGVPNDVKLSVKEWNKLSKSEKLKQSPVYKSEQRFGDVIENIVKIEQESILRKMGATKQEDGNYKLDAEKLAEFFKEEFIKRDLPNEVVNYLQAFEGEFLFPIDAFKQRATIERIAYSIANKKLVQQKITGEALVQVASTGFEITDKFSSVREDSDLPFYTEPGKAQKIKIAFTSRWKPLLNLEYKGKKIGKLEVLNEAIKDEEWLEQNRRAISIVGVRIPVQGLNSQEFMEVFHFLPESMGAVIVVSPALVAKSGGDFDIDKLTTFFPNFNKQGKLNTLASKEEVKELKSKIKTLSKKLENALSKLDEADNIQENLAGEIETYLFNLFDENEDIVVEAKKSLEKVNDRISKLVGISNKLDEEIKDLQSEIDQKSSPKKAYENELIDIIRETLSRPDNFLQLIRPNDTDLLNNKEYGAEKLKQMFVNAYQDDTFTSVVDFASILEAFKSNLVGKSNLGIAAVNNVLFALAQRAGLHHNETFTYRNTSGKMVTKPVEFYLPHNTVEVDGKELVSLAGLFSKDSNNYISDIISQYINGFVDVANDDWVFFIGAVKEFVPTMLYTAMAGTNAKTSIAFFNQPIMREYIKNIDKYKNLFTKLKDPKAYTNGNWKALEDAVYKYIKQDDELSQIFEEEGLKERGLPFIKVRDYVKENVSPNFLTEERLSDALYNDNTLSPKEQILLIFHFWELKRQSGILTNLQRSLNADTKKMGNGYSSIERQTMFDDVLKSNLFNADAMYRMRNESTIKAFTNDKTGFDTFSQQLFTDLFEITNHPTFNKVIRELINNDKELNFEFKSSKIEKLVNTIKNDFITYLYQNQVLDGNDNLFKKTQPLFNPKSSMSLELKNIKEKYSNLVKEFPILDLIIPDNLKAGNTILKTNLKLKSRLADKDELDNAVLQIRQLQKFNSPKYTPEQQIEIQQFTDRLIKFIIVQSGLNPSVYNLLDIVPNEAYTQNIKSIIKDVQNVLNKDINIPFALKIDKKSDSQKSLEKFYNRFRIENPAFYKFEPTDEELNLNFLNQRGKNYYLPTTDITGAKAKAVEDKLLAYIPTLPSKSVTVDKNNGQTLKQNPKSLFIVYDNEKEDNKKALSSMKITNFATITATSIEAMERQIDEIISKSMNYDTISFNTAKGYFQDVKESNPELFNYGSQRLKGRFGITNPGFEEVIEQPIQNKEGILKTHAQSLQNQLNTIIANKEEILKYLEDNDFGKAELYLVGGRTIGKDLKEDSDLDIIIKVEKTPFDNKKEFEKQDDRIFWMKDINKVIHKFGADLHVLEHFAKQAPKGKIIEQGLQIDFPNKFIEQPINKEIKPNELTNHSGGAKGGDMQGWDAIGREFGVTNHNHYTVAYYDKLTAQEKAELDKQYLETVKFLGRGVISKDTYAGKLVRRDMIQANNGESIYGVTELVKPNTTGRKGYKNKNAYSIPEGGTGYATARGILLNKPTYIFNQSDKYGNEIGWYKWDNNVKDFVKTEPPILTKNFTGIGSQEINELGLQAIRDVYQKTLNQPTEIKPKIDSSKKIEKNVIPNVFSIGNIGYSKNNDGKEIYYVAAPYGTTMKWEEIRKKYAITEEEYKKSYEKSLDFSKEEKQKSKEQDVKRQKEQAYWNNSKNNIVNKVFPFNVGENEEGFPYKHKVRIEKVHLLENGNYQIIAHNLVNGRDYDMITDSNGAVVSYTRNGKTFKGEVNDEIMFTADASVEPLQTQEQPIVEETKEEDGCITPF